MSATVKTVLPRCYLDHVVISYPHLFTARQFQGEGKFWYSAAFLINPRTQADQVKALEASCAAAADKLWPRGEWKERRRLNNPKVFWWPIRDGAEKAGKNGYDGMVFVQAKTETRPGVADQDVQPVVDQSLIYPGLVVNGWIRFSAYAKPSWGVGAYLENVQIVGGGERLGGRPDISDDFEPVTDRPAASLDFLA